MKDIGNIEPDVLFALIDYFNYSMRNVHSYDELSTEVKDIISKDTFNKMIV